MQNLFNTVPFPILEVVVDFQKEQVFYFRGEDVISGYTGISRNMSPLFYCNLSEIPRELIRVHHHKYGNTLTEGYSHPPWILKIGYLCRFQCTSETTEHTLTQYILTL